MQPTIAAIYARVSTKSKSKCPGCGKTVRLESGCFIEHRDRAELRCARTGSAVEALADHGQDTENQLIQLRAYCAKQGWSIGREYVDQVSGKTSERDAFRELFEDASRRKFDVVIVWALDRFTREGIYETFEHVRNLTRHGVQFESYTEAHFRTTGPAGELMLAIAAWIAKQERQRISERTKAGIARVRSQGKHWGRPLRVFRRDKAIELRRGGLSWRIIAEQLSRETGKAISFMTVRREVLGVTQRPGK